jgi:type IX secretion system PorP/SprF family membrane protein
MIKLKRILFVLLLGVVLPELKAQDPQFSQFFSNQMYLAPSFAGATGASRLTLSSRAQWLGVNENPAVYMTYLVAYDHYFANFNSGVGAILVQDRAGTAEFGVTEASVIYSYNLNMFRNWYLRPGLSFTYGEYGLDNEKLKFFGDLVDLETNINVQQKRYLDANASLLVYSKRVWFGFTAAHLMAPSLSIGSFSSDKSLGVTLFGGAEIIKYSKLLKPIDETLNLAGQIRIFNTQKQFDIGLYWYKHPLILGVWYRGIPVVNSQRGDALIALIGFKNSWMYFGYSYDFTVSNLISSSLGSHEISFNVKFRPPPKRKKLGAVPCPHF